MRSPVVWLLALLACVSTHAGILPGGAATSGLIVGYDAYGGVTNVACTNPNGTTYFGEAVVNSHKVLCDPAGHPYFGRGFFVFDFSSLGNDESGGNYNTYITAKYGATNTNYTWDTAEVARLKSWGFNMIGPDATAYALASWPWITGTNPNKVPFILTQDTCLYSWTNRFGLSAGPTKDVLSTASTHWHGTGYFGYQGTTDYEDPNWVTYVDAEMAGTGQVGFIYNVLAANATDKSYLIGVIGCDSDYTHGFDAGPDFVTYPSAGNADFRLSYELALGSPVEWASTHQDEIYTDSTVYGKKALYTEITGKYANIAALNTAWGSSYTTFGTSGTCFGSGFAAWICPSPSAATSVGTGNGSTLTFSGTLTTTVSANSVGIFVAGTLVGGDGGNGPFSGTAGTIYGPNLSGTINYSTGALSLTFAAGHAPANAAAITAEYIANGWGVGTGVMDEDGRSGHLAWVGNNSVCIDGVGQSANCTEGGGTSYASAGMVTDLNALDVTLATQYASTYQSAVNANLPGALFLGNDTCGTWGVPPNRYVLQGWASTVSLCLMSITAQETSQQTMLDFIHTYAGDMALGQGEYNTVNADSPFAWPNTSCTHSGTTVTCTVSTPQNFSTGNGIETTCTDSTYNVSFVDPSSVTTTTVVYTAGTTPTNASTTCNLFFSDSQESQYATQAARASAVATQLNAITSLKYTADGIYPYVMTSWWQWSDKQDEFLAWGIVDTRDNAYDGLETKTATGACQAPLAAYNCGGELRSGWGTTDGITPVKNANLAIDQAVAGF